MATGNRGLSEFTVKEATNLISQRKVIRVTPVVVAGTTDNNDVMFASTEIPNAVLSPGGSSKLIGITIIDYDVEAHDMDLVFMQVSTDLGTINEAVTVSDANLRLANVLGGLIIDWSDGAITMGSVSSIYTGTRSTGNALNTHLPMILQAEAGSTSVYFAGIAREAMAYAAVDNLDFIFHIEY